MNDCKLEMKVKDEIDQICIYLSSKPHNNVLYGLNKLFKLLKKDSIKETVVAKGGISYLLSLLNEFSLGRRSQVTRDVSYAADQNKTASTELALGCLERLSRGAKSFGKEFENANGSKALKNLLSLKQSECVIKRACCLIASLYENEGADSGIVTSLVNLLPSYESNICTVAIHRTLWSICQNAVLIDYAVLADGFPSFVKALESDQGRIVKSTLKVLHRFFRVANGSEKVGLRVLAFNGLPLLLTLMQMDIPDEQLKMVSDCLHHMIGVPQIRVSLCGTDFIDICTAELSKDVRSQRFKNAFSSLCLCAMEAVNRSRMRTSGALQKLVKLLGETKYSNFHFQIVSTFVCFLFDDSSLDVMLRAGLLNSLQLYLERILDMSSSNQLEEQAERYVARSFIVKSTEGSPVLPSADGSVSNIHGARGPFQDVLLILAKLSQTRAIRFMVTRECVNPLLKYMSINDSYDLRSERVLTRITQNALFFEMHLKLGLVQSIYYQLNTGFSVHDLETLFSGVMSSRDKDNPVLINRNIISFRELHPLNEAIANKRHEIVDVCVTKIEGFDHSSPNDNGDMKTDSPKGIRTASEENSSSSFKSKKCGKSLLMNLTRHAESLFGQGVLAHGLLSDSCEIKEAFVTGFCYICRSSAAIKKIFVDLNGLEIVGDMLSDQLSSHAKLCNAALACKGLADSLSVAWNAKKRIENCGKNDLAMDRKRGFGRFDVEDVCNASRKKQKVQDDGKQNCGNSCCVLSTVICNYEAKELSTGRPALGIDCFVENDKLKAENACFFLEGYVRIYVAKSVLCSVSPVFAAMLSGNFVDSTLPYVELQDVNATTFVVLLHYVHGCDIDFETLQCCTNCRFSGRIDTSKHSVPGIPDSEMTSYDDNCSDCTENDQIESLSETLSRDHGGRFLTKSHCVSKHLTSKQKLGLMADLLRLSDRFMVDGLRDDCQDYLTGSLAVGNMAALFVEAVTCQATRLAACCVSFMLSKMKDPTDYLTTFAKLLGSAEHGRFITDVQHELLTRIQAIVF